MKRKYTDDDLIREFSNASSIADLLRKLGINNSGGSAAVVKKYMLRLGLNPEEIKNKAGVGISKSCPPRWKLEDILVKNSSYSIGGTSSLKRRLLKEGLLGDSCEICGCSSMWNGKSLVLVLDHINGNKRDNRLENLRLVCPNCNSQLSTFCGKNAKK